MTARPRVSVIVPTYNAERTLAPAIHSIEEQECAELEIVVVDDASSDGTAGLVEGLGVDLRYLRQEENRGPSAARNVGLRETTGDLVAFLDADDTWPARSLRLRLDALAARPECGYVQGYLQDLWPDLHGPDRHQLEPPYFNTYNLGCGLFRRSLFETIGGFNEALRTGEDIDLIVRAKTHGLRSLRLDDVTLFYRRRLVDDIDANRRFQANFAGAIKRSLDTLRRKSD